MTNGYSATPPYHAANQIVHKATHHVNRFRMGLASGIRGPRRAKHMCGGGGDPTTRANQDLSFFRSGMCPVIMQNAFTAKVKLNKEFQRGPCDTCLRSLRACINFRRFISDRIGEEAYCYSGAVEIG
jgi:hypothetical protein